MNRLNSHYIAPFRVQNKGKTLKREKNFSSTTLVK